jgi:hypothetical protein
MEFNSPRSRDHDADHGVDAGVVEGLGFDPFTDSPSVLLDQVCDLEPGLFVQSILEMLDPSALTPTDAVRYLQVHERVTSWWASRQVAALVAAAGRTPTVDEYVLLDRLSDTEREVRIHELARDEIAAALRWGPVSTQNRIDQARLLVGPLAATHESFSLGEITAAHVRLIADSTQRLSSWDALEQATHEAARVQDAGISPEVAAVNQRALNFALAQAQLAFDSDCLELQDKVLPTARAQGYSRTKAKTNREIGIIDAAGQARRRAAARRKRDVYIVPDVDGLSMLIARLDTFTANAIMAAINAAVANPHIITSPFGAGACDATLGERRGEALAALIFGTPNVANCTSSSCTTPIAINLSLDLTVPITELDAATNSASEAGASTSNGASNGAGASTSIGANANNGAGGSADAIGCDFRQLLADPAVKVFARPVAISETGHVLDIGRRRYQITGALRRLITTRDGTCRFPGCNRNAARCQIDHVTPWDEGGRSDADNLGALCVRHHQLKTHGGWEITDSKPDGSCTWRSPDGRIYHHHPQPIVTLDTALAAQSKTKTRRINKHERPEQPEPLDIPTF